MVDATRKDTETGIAKRTWGIRTLSPLATPMGRRLPSLSKAPGPTARTLASFCSLTLLSGRKIPEAVLASGLMRWTRTRSRRGARDLMLRRTDYSKRCQYSLCANRLLMDRWGVRGKIAEDGRDPMGSDQTKGFRA